MSVAKTPVAVSDAIKKLDASDQGEHGSVVRAVRISDEACQCLFI